MTLDIFSLAQNALALGAAYVLALPIAWNRERKSLSAGLRTFPLVAMSSCAFVEVSETMSGANPEAVARVLQGVITGIGFIGGGAILKHGTTIRGTATATALWATGAIGLAAGLGNFAVAAMISVFVFLTFSVMTRFKTGD